MTARRPGPTVRTKVTELRPDGEQLREDRLATEEPLEIRMTWPGSAPRRIWVTMRTPGHDFELAAGYAVHEGLLGPDLLRGVAYCTDEDLTPRQEYNVVTVTLGGPPWHDPGQRHGGFGAGAACGVCGKDSIEEVLSLPRSQPWGGAVPSDDVVRELPERLRRAQTVFARTGGVHAAGLFDADGVPLVVREDIGRHNAVDKTSGARLLAGRAPAAACLVVSGRAGFELVQKAVAVGHGCLVAVGAPSSLAVDLARDAGLGLYGFTSERRVVRYA
ncbi:formate dehydrogenase accessory sulfurtransferase FdhD [Nocardioides sp.]|uniref:formate dehydrogenase accessory sulfurtransferase FdhD n=1 Tax=Nocardioides sp. TaxID=35761 RepID=UPI003528298D